MLNSKADKESVIIILHEIYGINPHIEWVHKQYLAAGFDVLCPDFLESKGHFPYSKEEEAYQYFVQHIGFSSMAHEVKKMIMKVRKDYKHVFLLGFSIGATVAWLCSEIENGADGVICYYGSRIRDYQDIMPKCPTLLIFAEEEKSIDVSQLASILAQKKFVRVHVIKGKHGFSDSYSKHYNQHSQQVAQNLVDKFIGDILV